MKITKATNSRFKQKQINNDEKVQLSLTTQDVFSPENCGLVKFQVKNYLDEEGEKYEYFTVYLSRKELEDAIKFMDSVTK